MKRVFLGLVFVFLFTFWDRPSQAQTDQQSYAARVKQLMHEADSLQKVNMYECHEALQEIYQLSTAEDDDSTSCRILTRLGYTSHSLGKVDSAIHYLSRFFDECGTKWPDFYVDAKMRMANIYRTLSNEEMMMTCVLEAQAELPNIKSDESRVLVHLNFARVYQSMDKIEQQKHHSLEALKIVEKSNIERQKVTVYSYVGVAYNALNQPDSAIYYQKRAAIESARLGNNRQLAISTANMGEVFYSSGQYDSAAFYMHKADELAKKLGDFDFNMYLGSAIARADAATGNYKAAYERAVATHEELNEAMDERHVQAISDMKVKYDTELKEEQVEQLEQGRRINELEIQRTNARYALAVAIIGLFVIILGILVYFFRKLRQTNRALDEANATKDKFFAIIAHDLRGAATAFQGVGTMMSTYVKSGKTERIEALTGMIDESASRLNKLLDNLLQWALAQLNNVPYHPENAKLKAMLKDVLDQVENHGSAKQVEIVTDLPEDLEVFADADGLRLITRNLLMNAIKFTEAGGKVLVQARKLEKDVELEIRDSGIGMNDDQIQHLFELKDSKKTRGTAGEKGSGIGLLLVKEFIELNKGSIQVESKPGEGSSFKVYLPKAA